MNKLYACEFITTHDNCEPSAPILKYHSSIKYDVIYKMITEAKAALEKVYNGIGIKDTSIEFDINLHKANISFINEDDITTKWEWFIKEVEIK